MKKVTNQVLIYKASQYEGYLMLSFGASANARTEMQI